MHELIAELIAEILGGAALVLIGFFLPRAWQMISGIAVMVFSDLPRVAGKWRATYTEPTEQSAATERMTEQIRLWQIGRFIWGRTRVVDTRNRKFAIRGKLIWGTFVGTAKRVRS